MFKTVREDTRGRAWIDCRGMLARWTAIPLVILCGLASTTVLAQSGDAAPRFQATVMDLSKDTQSISVALNRSAIIQTNIKVTRVDIVAGRIAEVRLISPTEILVTGSSYGRTNIILWNADDRQFLLTVGVEIDLEELGKALVAIDPQSTAKATSILGNIVLSGTVSSIERAQRMVELPSSQWRH